MIAQAQARITSQDAVDILDQMMVDRISQGGNVRFSASQFASLNDSTRSVLNDCATGGTVAVHGRNFTVNAAQAETVRNNTARVADEIELAPEQRAKLNATALGHLNAARAGRTDGGNINPLT